MWFPERSWQKTRNNEGKCEEAGRELREKRSVFLSNMSDGRETSWLLLSSGHKTKNGKRKKRKKEK